MDLPVGVASDEEEEEEEHGEERARCLLGFMFGNVDASGDVDADYLEEGARDHLAALADQLGPSLAGLDLLGSPPGVLGPEHGEAEEVSSTGPEHDCDAHDGVPEPDEVAGGGDLFPEDYSFPVASFLGEDEDYDADGGELQEPEVVGDDPSPGSPAQPEFSGAGEADVNLDAVEDRDDAAVVLQEPAVRVRRNRLPILCVENGEEILRFSEIFGVQEPPKKAAARRVSRPITSSGVEAADGVEEDEENLLKRDCRAPVAAAGRLGSADGGAVNAGGGDGGPPSLAAEHGRVSCLPGLPMKERSSVRISPRLGEAYRSVFSPLEQQDWEDQIVWGSSPAASDRSSGSCVMSEHGSDGDASRRHKGIPLQNKNLLDGRWLDDIIWDPGGALPEPNLVLHPRDEQVMFGSLDHQNDWRVFSRVSSDVPCHPSNELPVEEFNLSNDEFYTGSRVTGKQLSPSARRRSDYFSKVIHSAPALKLQTMKPRLSTKEIANFHQPKAFWYPHENELVNKMRGNLVTQGFIKIILKCLGGKKIKLRPDVAEKVSSVKSRVSKKLGIKFPETYKIIYSGKELEDDSSLDSQGIKPNSLLHIVRSKIHLWPAVQFSPGAFRRMSDLTVKIGHVFLLEYCEERPLLLGNIGMAARLCTYFRKSAANGVIALLSQDQGNVIGLNPEDESPFLGDINPGCSQLSLETNMYRAPLFPHRLPSTDYLLVRSANGMLSLRRINRVYVVGQQEPHIEVVSPGVRSIRSYNLKRLLVHVYRELSAKQKAHLLPHVQADDLSLQFPSLNKAFVRKSLKRCAALQRRPDGSCFWIKRREFLIPSEEEIRRILAPEDVCSYESMQAGLYRLKHLGISRLTRPISLPHRLTLDHSIVSHIQRELLLTPWHVTGCFVASVNQGSGNVHCLEFVGAGDPSGRGLGFSYICAAHGFSSLRASKKKASTNGVSSVSDRADKDPYSPTSGTRLNLDDYQATKMTRSNPKAKVGRGSSDLVASGSWMGATNPNSRRMSHLQFCQQAMRKCQEIWNRQIQSLSSADANEGSPGVGGDLDPFAEDLENLLDIEEVWDGRYSLERANGTVAFDEGKQTGKHPYQVQEEEENEDDEVEAAMISRWFHWDDKIKTIKNVKVKPVPKRSKAIIMQDHELQKYPFEGSVCLSQKDAYESGDVRDRLVKSKSNILEVTQEVTDEKGHHERSRRENFVCGACGQMGHMKTNKHCPMYGKEMALSELGSVSAEPKLTASKMELSTHSSDNKLLKVEICEKGNKSGTDTTERALQLKFRYVSSDEYDHGNISGTLHHPGVLLTSKEKASAVHVPKHDGIIVDSGKTSSEGTEGRVQKSRLVLRLPTQQKISFKPLKPKDVNTLEQGARATELESDNGFRNARRCSKPAHLEEQMQTGELSPKDTSRRAEERYFLRQGWRHQKMAEGKQTEGGNNLKKGKNRKASPVFWSSYSREYKTTQKSRRMHDRDQVTKGCHFADNSPPTKRRRGGEVLLSNILETIANSLREKYEISYLFTKPVSKKEAPDYLDVIEHPMDLSTIKDKAKRMEYKSREAFRNDVWLINSNAHRYNDGRSPSIALLADKLLDLCDNLLYQNSAILTEAEAEIAL